MRKERTAYEKYKKSSGTFMCSGDFGGFLDGMWEEKSTGSG